MARMTVEEKIELIRQLHDVHERLDLGGDQFPLIQLQHELEELLSYGSSLLSAHTTR
jgi:hypothetical protein